MEGRRGKGGQHKFVVHVHARAVLSAHFHGSGNMPKGQAESSQVRGRGSGNVPSLSRG